MKRVQTQLRKAGNKETPRGIKTKASTLTLEKTKLSKLTIAKSIKTKLIIITVMFATIPLLLVNIISSSVSASTLKETSTQLTSDIVNQTSSSINYFLEDIEKNVTKYIINDLNSQTNNLLISYSKVVGNPGEKVKVVQSIKRSLVYLGSIEKSIEGAILISKDGTVMGNGSSVKEGELAQLGSMEFNGEYLWSKGLGSDEKNVYFIRKVSNTAIGEEFGIMVAPIKLDNIIADMKKIKLLEGANVYLTDETGKIIYNKNSEQLHAEAYVWDFVGGNEEPTGSAIKKDTLITYATANNGWKIIAELPQKSLTRNLSTASTLIWMLIAVLAVIAVLVSVVFSKSFSTPIINMMKLMKLAEEGDLTVRIDTKRTDEIGLLCLSFNKMISNIQKLLEDTQHVIEGTIEGSKTLNNSTNQSVEAFEQLASSIEEIATGSSNQAIDAQKTAKAMNQLSDSIQEVMDRTKSIYTDNQGAKVIIEEASHIMNTLNTTMSSSIQVSGKIKDSIIELSTLTRSIGEIMKLVDGISEQTNLLALNASIEAARAGEVGKGFAVVAHEVRNLAEQSKKSTHNVRSTLNTIEKKTSDAVDLVKESNRIFADQEQAVNKAYTAFLNIIEKLKSMDINIGNVNTEVNDMEQLKEKMLENISRIKMITEETAAATEEVNALSEEQKAVMMQLLGISYKLNESMDVLNSSMANFKID